MKDIKQESIIKGSLWPEPVEKVEVVRYFVPLGEIMAKANKNVLQG
ncbi:MAG: hypothetical protein U9P49_01715 [Thermodesulfobacteriota bacterium]|nr:hypothetical protein [Thermodesulfobacteriota bacterium]